MEWAWPTPMKVYLSKNSTEQSLKLVGGSLPISSCALPMFVFDIILQTIEQREFLRWWGQCTMCSALACSRDQWVVCRRERENHKHVILVWFATCDCDGGKWAWAHHRGRQQPAGGRLHQHQRDPPSPGDEIQQKWLLTRLPEGECHICRSSCNVVSQIIVRDWTMSSSNSQPFC